jgi:hypothetical protein
MISTLADRVWRSTRRRKIVLKDREDPHARGSGAPQLVQTLERPQAGVLRQILGLGGVGGEAQRRAIEIVEVRQHVGLESPDAVLGRVFPWGHFT